MHGGSEASTLKRGSGRGFRGTGLAWLCMVSQSPRFGMGGAAWAVPRTVPQTGASTADGPHPPRLSWHTPIQYPGSQYLRQYSRSTAVQPQFSRTRAACEDGHHHGMAALQLRLCGFRALAPAPPHCLNLPTQLPDQSVLSSTLPSLLSLTPIPHPGSISRARWKWRSAAAMLPYRLARMPLLSCTLALEAQTWAALARPRVRVTHRSHITQSHPPRHMGAVTPPTS